MLWKLRRSKRGGDVIKIGMVKVYHRNRDGQSWESMKTRTVKVGKPWKLGRSKWGSHENLDGQSGEAVETGTVKEGAKPRKIGRSKWGSNGNWDSQSELDAADTVTVKVWVMP